MQEMLTSVLKNYLNEKSLPYKNNKLAHSLRHEFKDVVANIVSNNDRFIVSGSAGKGQWTDCPWIALLDSLITSSPQSGFYPVYIFKSDMSGVYLSLNQGVTSVKDEYKRGSKDVLRIRADNFRAKLQYSKSDIVKIDLSSKGSMAKDYEAGNIISIFYPVENIPSSDILEKDLLRYMRLYEELTFNDSEITETLILSGIEKKQLRFHFRIERASNNSKKVKEIKGYICEACQFDFSSTYGIHGKNFIEAHHLRPMSTLGIGEFSINFKTDFAVLCSNCHSMIHRLADPGDIKALQLIINQAKLNVNIEVEF